MKDDREGEMVKIFIDGKPVEVKEGTTVLKAAEQAGVHIPHFCFHPAFVPEGSCRMCLVEIEGLPKLELACSTVVREGMKVSTGGERVSEARKSVLEFLLAEHPLDCPICDKAGDCKLQDYYREYGLFENKFDEFKEKRNKKIRIGKSLILDQERCILCTRCVRFLKEVTRTEELGVLNRGLHSEVNIYENTPVDNNYSGNLAEVCPVGAITDADFRFKTRNWFLDKGESICPLCSRGCNITIEFHRGFARFPLEKRVYRVKSVENAEVNGFWICDLGRYGYLYLNQDRIDRVLQNGNGKSTATTWEEGVAHAAGKVIRLHHMKRTEKIALVLSTWLSNEELFLVHKIFRNDLGVKKIYFADPKPGEADGFLLTSERTPNRKGAEEIGFEIKPLNREELVEETELLFVFGHFLLDHLSLADLKDVLDRVETKILLTAHSTGLNSLFDLVFPVALVAEKDGSLTNINGKVQAFRPALKPCGESRPEWRVLVDLARELKINFGYYRQFISSEAVSRTLAEEIPFFEKKK